MRDEIHTQVGWFYDSSTQFLKCILGARYSLTINKPKGLEIFVPFVLLPKHSSVLDIPYEGIFLKYSVDRRAYYLMKASIPRPFRDVLELYGGVVVRRRKDLDPGLPEEEKDRLMEEEKKRVDGIMAKLLDSGEIVVDHIEGTRRANEPFKLRQEIIYRLVNLDTKQMPAFVPLDIRYSSEISLRPRVILTAGNPIATRDGPTLEYHLREFFKV